jgi:hypothetical protein
MAGSPIVMPFCRVVFWLKQAPLLLAREGGRLEADERETL